jgi:hypothetical protein
MVSVCIVAVLISPQSESLSEKQIADVVASLSDSDALYHRMIKDEIEYINRKIDTTNNNIMDLQKQVASKSHDTLIIASIERVISAEQKTIDEQFIRLKNYNKKLTIFYDEIYRRGK